MTGQRNRTKFLTNYMAMAMRTSKHRVINKRHWYSQRYDQAVEAWERIDRLNDDQWMYPVYDGAKINYEPTLNDQEQEQKLERLEAY